MIKFILLIFILLNPISAVGSDFYDGLTVGELIGDLNTPESFEEVPNVDLAEWSPDKYENIASNANQSALRVASSVNNAGGLALSEVSHALSNQGGVDHAANHLSESGLLKGRPNSKAARAEFKEHATRILMDPDAIIDIPEGLKRGQVPVKGYLGKVDGQDVIVWIAQKAGGKRHAAGQIVTAFQPSSTQLYNYKMKHAFKVFRNPLSNQRYRASEVPRVRANIPTRTPRTPRVTGAGKVTGFAGALVIDCAVSGGITGFMGGDAVEGCVDGLAGTEPVADGTVTGQEELDLGAALYHGKINNPLHPDHKLIDDAGKSLLDSRVNFRTSKILDGPYQGKCIAIKNGYTVAVECGSLAGHEKVGTPTERLLEKMGELAPPPPVYMPIPVVY